MLGRHRWPNFAINSLWYSSFSRSRCLIALASAEGITYTLDQMDSDIISRLKTPADGFLVLLPYPVVTVDMGQHLARMKTPTEIETGWITS